MRVAKLTWVPIGILCLISWPIDSYGQSLEENVKAGWEAFAQERHSDAERLLSTALRQAESQKLENQTMQVILFGLAGVYRQQKRYDEAEQSYLRLFTLIEKSPEVNVRLAIGAANGLGNTYLNQKKYTQAERVFKKSVEGGEKFGGDAPGEVGIAFDGLAITYLVQRKYDEAEPIYKRAIAHYEKAFGPNDRRVASALERYAELLRRLERNREAEQIEARAKEIRRK